MVNAIVVISLELDEPEQLPAVLEHMQPSMIPHFAGQVRVAIQDSATQVIDWLEGRTDTLGQGG